MSNWCYSSTRANPDYHPSLNPSVIQEDDMTYAQQEEEEDEDEDEEDEDEDDDDEDEDDDDEDEDDRRAETVGNDVQYIHWHTQVMPSN